MLTSIDPTAGPTQVDYDVCILGAGAAGLTLAAEFLRSSGGNGLRVALLEGGGLDSPVFSDPLPGADPNAAGKMFRTVTSASQFLYEGDLRGWLPRAKPEYLTSSRLRTCGGSGVSWSGWWLPLEQRDFDVPDGGHARWPIAYADLAPYYERVHHSMGLGPYTYDDASLVTVQPSAPVSPLPLADTPLRSRIVLFKRVDFFQRYREEIQASATVDLYRNANFEGFEVSAPVPGQPVRLEGIRVRALDGRRPAAGMTVSARSFVLAAGALENTRILLASGLGDATGQVGCHFCEHPYLWTAARLDWGAKELETYGLYLGQRPLPVSEGVGAMGVVVPRSGWIDEHRVGSFRALLGGADGVPGTISLCWEQSSDTTSRVTLAEDLPPDCLGVPRIRIMSDVSDRDRRTVVEAIGVLTETLARLGLARTTITPPLREDPWSWQHPGHIVPGNHPLGITRMAAQADQGVTDRDCRVYGTTNLFVTGSGLFPTGGHANPMITILALASRLADHLQGKSPTRPACFAATSIKTSGPIGPIQ